MRRHTGRCGLEDDQNKCEMFMGVLPLYLQAVIPAFIMTLRRDRFPLEYAFQLQRASPISLRSFGPSLHL